MVAEPLFAAFRAAAVFLIAAVIFIVIYFITVVVLDYLAGFLAGDVHGYNNSVWVHFVLALSAGLLLFYAPQNYVHLEPMIAVMALSVFIGGVLAGGVLDPTGRDVWTWIKKWRLTIQPASLSYTLGWFSAIVVGVYLVLRAGQWQGVFPGTWDVFAVISDPRIGATLMIPCAYLGATQYVYQIPYMKAADSVDDAVFGLPFYRAGADIYDQLPADADVSPRDIELTIVEHATAEDTFDAAHRATAEDYLDEPDLESYLHAHELTLMQRDDVAQLLNEFPDSFNLNEQAVASLYTRLADQGVSRDDARRIVRGRFLGEHGLVSDNRKSGGDEPQGPAGKRDTEGLAQHEYDWQRSDVTFADIGGYYPVKEALNNEVIEPLRATTQGDDRFDRFDIEPKSGILFHGPPGTGKTLFARALAGELGVPFVELSPADVTSKWINEGPDRVQELFTEAAQLAPCVVFLDEAEHLFGGRDTSARTAHAEDRKITSEFLVQLAQQQSDVVVVSATNRPGDIDPAILRPGRLATHYEVGLPDEETRHAILETKLDVVPSALTGEDLATLAAHTQGFSGADLEDLVDDAKRAAAKRDAEAVTLDDFPSIEELDAIVATHEQVASTASLPDPEAPSSMAGADDRDDDSNDEPSVGYE